MVLVCRLCVSGAQITENFRKHNGDAMMRQTARDESAPTEKATVDWSSLPVGELVGTELEWSTIAAETRSATQALSFVLPEQ